jgi:SAM-dependent methyltransferase
VSVFGQYSRYYDLLYRDKDYAGETQHVAGLIERYKAGTRSILELGCGSGMHATHFGKMGYTVTGVDMSRDMLEAAQARLAGLPKDVAQRLSFSEGDVRSVRVGKKFDCVISLFHVISYQPTNADLQAAFKTVREHLNPGGIFIFDCWYGPAVLTDRPAVRVKRMQDDQTEVTRIAEPVWHPNECLVDVNYRIMIRDRRSGVVEELQETHRMRYLFMPEIELLAAAAGLQIEYAAEWLTGKAPGAATWGVCFVLRG